MVGHTRSRPRSGSPLLTSTSMHRRSCSRLILCKWTRVDCIRKSFVWRQLTRIARHSSEMFASTRSCRRTDKRRVSSISMRRGRSETFNLCRSRRHTITFCPSSPMIARWRPAPRSWWTSKLIGCVRRDWRGCPKGLITWWVSSRADGILTVLHVAVWSNVVNENCCGKFNFVVPWTNTPL